MIAPCRRAGLLALGALVLAAPLHAQTAQVYSANASNGRILRVSFNPPATGVVNSDASLRVSLQGMVLRDDGVGGTHLVVCDTQRGEVLFYPHPLVNAAGQTITAAIPLPDGPSLDAAGNLFVVNSGPGAGTSKIRSVFRIDRGGLAPGGYAAPVAIDTNLPADLLEDTRIVSFNEGLLQAGDLLVLSRTPARIWRYPGGTPCANPAACTAAERVELVPTSAFPSGAEPTGFAFAPDRSLLVSTLGGTVLRFGPDGQARADFFSGLGNGPFKITVGPQDGAHRAFVTDRNGGKVVRLRFLADGTGDVLTEEVTTGVQHPVGIASTTSNVVPTPASTTPLTITPTDVTEVTFREVTVPGVTNARVFYFEDPRETPAGFTGESLVLDAIDAALSPQVIPPYVRAFRKDDPNTGPPTFLLVVMDTTAGFSGPALLHGEEEVVLGYDPPCNAPGNRSGEGRWFYSPETGAPKSEAPIVESPNVTDITSGCGSMLGHTKGFSMFLVGRDTRPLDGPRTVDASGDCTDGIVDCKLNRLRAVVQGGTCIANRTRKELSRSLDGAIRAYDRGGYVAAAGKMAEFEATARDGVGFGACADNLQGELEARALSTIFMLSKLP